MSKNAASQFGWPRVENILKVGSKSFCQQLEVRLPVNIRHDGSLPKCEGIPQIETANAEMTIARSSFCALCTFKWASAVVKMTK